MTPSPAAVTSRSRAHALLLVTIVIALAIVAVGVLRPEGEPVLARTAQLVEWRLRGAQVRDLDRQSRETLKRASLVSAPIALRLEVEVLGIADRMASPDATAFERMISEKLARDAAAAIAATWRRPELTDHDRDQARAALASFEGTSPDPAVALFGEDYWIVAMASDVRRRVTVGELRNQLAAR